MARVQWGRGGHRLRAADWTIGGTGNWFKDNYFPIKHNISSAGEFIETRAANNRGNCRAINKEFQYRGLELRLDEGLVSKNSLSCASILDLNMEWAAAGKEAEVYIPYFDRNVPGFYLNDRFQEFRLRGFSHSIFRLDCKKLEHSVYIQRYDGKSMDDIQLWDTVYDIYARLRSAYYNNRYTVAGSRGVYIPMVDLRQSGPLTFLEGASIQNKDGRQTAVGQAVHESRLRMSEAGIQPFSSVGLPVDGNVSYVDGPFLFWMMLKGEMMFAAYISEDGMKRPLP